MTDIQGIIYLVYLIILICFFFFLNVERKMCHERSQQDIQEGNRNDMQSEVLPLGTSREEKIKIMKIICVE